MVYADIKEKTMGSKLLLRDFEIRILAGEKIGLIGRNGTGKTTLFNLISGVDKDYDGKIEIQKQTVLRATLQEHSHIEAMSTLHYITSRLPRFNELDEIIQNYPETMGDNLHKQSVFADALTEFSERGYYDVENSILSYFDGYQLPHELLKQEIHTLSGGQKRLIDLIAIQISNPSVALLDEPTNHMDFVAKEKFIAWLTSTTCACLIISHDRDVLQAVGRIIELKDYTNHDFPGNYDDYLKQNSVKTIGKMQSFETTEKRIAHIKEQIRYAKIKAKSKAGGNTGRSGKNQWVVLQSRLEKELEDIESTHERPSFWIDRESVDKLPPKIGDKYDKYKAKNIKLRHLSDDTTSMLFNVHALTLGYNGNPLFAPISFQLLPGDKMHIVGRNGAGKTTLIRALVDASRDNLPPTLIGKGTIDHSSDLRISVYEQELRDTLLNMTLNDAVETIYHEAGQPVQDESIRRILSQYLFDPLTDGQVLVQSLSGGQKARLQLIRLLAGKPNLLILDEPTNHLDLPSIEELENALLSFNGSILFISHDSYFARRLGGNRLTLTNL